MKTRAVLFIIILFTLWRLDTYAQNLTDGNDTTVYFKVDKYPVLIANNKYYEIDKIK